MIVPVLEAFALLAFAATVVPLLRFVQVDFSAQRPDWYVEPTVEAA
ncbi:hypothetical protein ABUV12_006553 [Pseudomonas aeruginosa]|nr:phage/plasmid replication protein [Pseudomonas aeruginosa]MCZ8010070.1 phage/plasmid replication protein [Pseudomonas aeruginosa]